MHNHSIFLYLPSIYIFFLIVFIVSQFILIFFMYLCIYLFLQCAESNLRSHGCQAWVLPLSSTLIPRTCVSYAQLRQGYTKHPQSNILQIWDDIFNLGGIHLQIQFAFSCSTLVGRDNSRSLTFSIIIAPLHGAGTQLGILPIV